MTTRGMGLVVRVCCIGAVAAMLPLGTPSKAEPAPRTQTERTAPVGVPPPRPRDLAIPPPALPSVSAPAEQSPAKPVEPQSPVTSTPTPPGEGACMRALAAIAGNRIRQPDAKQYRATDPACRVQEPVVVEALTYRASDGPGTVVFAPPVTISCAMATTVSQWLDDTVQPLARGHFGRELSRLQVGGGYECRRRNRSTAGPVSEHATGQALDIFAFVMGEERSGGVRVMVEKPAGLAQDRFLKSVRQSACGAFATSLGPGSDAAHANHLHVDIQPRRSAAARFCQ
ncbi:extensin-like domain-containing protein [Bosea sp. 2RAB26]|uniref:extensin-like domain-containing protein n=1 Tax=Bosea sp. 2RAB26 TaxID=3237476 RepID=UPI003F8ECBBF